MIRCGPSFSCDLLHSPYRQFEIPVRSLLRLFDESMQKYHSAVMNAEHHASDPTLLQTATHFPESFAKHPTQRHADRPRKFHVLDVFADNFAILAIKCFEPFP